MSTTHTLGERDAAVLGTLLERVREETLNEPHRLADGNILGAVGREGLNSTWVLKSWTALIDLCIRQVYGEEPLDDAQERLVARNVGIELALEGLTLQEALGSLMKLRSVAMESLRVHSVAENLSAQFVVLGINHIALGWNDFMLSTSEGHLAAELESKSRVQAMKDSFVLRALQGGESRVELYTDLETYGIDRSAKYLAFRTRPGTEEEWRGFLEYFELDVENAYRHGMATVIDGDLCGFTTELPITAPKALIGRSDPVSFLDLPSAFRSASRAFYVASRLNLLGDRSLGDLGLMPAVVSDQDVNCALAERYILPLETYGNFGQVLLDTVNCYVQNNCRLAATALALEAHENTVRHRIARFEEVVGYSLRDTSRLAEVWWLLQARRINLGTDDMHDAAV